MDVLPWELIEEILGYLTPSERRQALKSCSLIKRLWTPTSQTILFEHVLVYHLKRWLHLAPQVNDELVKSVLHITFDGMDFSLVHPILSASRSRVPALEKLNHLEFSYCRISLSLWGLEWFSPSKLNLSHITLTSCSISIRSFAHIINNFPNLKSISISRLDRSYKDKLLPGPCISRTLEKLSLDLGSWPWCNPKLLEGLTKRGLKFNKVDLKPDLGHHCPWVNNYVHTLGAGAKWLRLPFVFPDLFNYSTLSSCLELRELYLVAPMGLPRPEELGCISAIKSKKIQKITIHRFTSISYGTVPWTRFDDSLTALAKQLEGNTRLEVEFRCSRGEIDPRDEEISLPKFVKKGRVTVWDVENNLVRCSDYDEFV